MNNSMPNAQPFIPNSNFNSPIQQKQQQIRQSPPNNNHNRPGLYQQVPFQNQTIPNNMSKMSPTNNFINTRTE